MKPKNKTDGQVVNGKLSAAVAALWCTQTRWKARAGKYCFVMRCALFTKIVPLVDKDGGYDYGR
ncbi:hypothetical protein KCP73_11255 [Salmonella enterica subsp. enterica]|nr:hypothetical protein KCP73_11255 [Salmonella enterica subsp. enterica]